MMTRLSSDQAGRIERARKALAEADAAGPDTHSLAYSVGVLSVHLGEMIALLDGMRDEANGGC